MYKKEKSLRPGHVPAVGVQGACRVDMQMPQAFVTLSYMSRTIKL